MPTKVKLKLTLKDYNEIRSILESLEAKPGKYRVKELLIAFGKSKLAAVKITKKKRKTSTK